MSCIEAEQEGSAAFSGILCDPGFGSIDSLGDSAMVKVVVALNLFLADAVRLDA